MRRKCGANSSRRRLIRYAVKSLDMTIVWRPKTISPYLIARFMTAALKGYLFFTTRREASINYMMAFLKSNDRDALTAIYDASVKVMTRDGVVEDERVKAVG